MWRDRLICGAFATLLIGACVVLANDPDRSNVWALAVGQTCKYGVIWMCVVALMWVDHTGPRDVACGVFAVGIPFCTFMTPAVVLDAAGAYSDLANASAVFKLLIAYCAMDAVVLAALVCNGAMR